LTSSYFRCNTKTSRGEVVASADEGEGEGIFGVAETLVELLECGPIRKGALRKNLIEKRAQVYRDMEPHVCDLASAAEPAMLASDDESLSCSRSSNSKPWPSGSGSGITRKNSPAINERVHPTSTPGAPAVTRLAPGRLPSAAHINQWCADPGCFVGRPRLRPFLRVSKLRANAGPAWHAGGPICHSRPGLILLMSKFARALQAYLGHRNIQHTGVLH
jgi:hypothetical protein